MEKTLRELGKEQMNCLWPDDYIPNLSHFVLCSVQSSQDVAFSLIFLLCLFCYFFPLTRRKAITTRVM